MYTFVPNLKYTVNMELFTKKFIYVIVLRYVRKDVIPSRVHVKSRCYMESLNKHFILVTSTLYNLSISPCFQS